MGASGVGRGESTQVQGAGVGRGVGRRRACDAAFFRQRGFRARCFTLAGGVTNATVARSRSSYYFLWKWGMYYGEFKVWYLLPWPAEFLKKESHAPCEWNPNAWGRVGSGTAGT